MIQTVIFDFDGVIADSEPVHFRAFVQVFEPEGITFDFDEYCRELIGFDDRDVARHLLTTRQGLSEGPELTEKARDVCQRKQEAFNEIVQRQGMPTIPGAVELIDNLVQRNVPIALATGATYEDLKQAFGPANRLECFKAIVTADDVQRSKPDPQTYRMAFEKVQQVYGDAELQPQNALAIEDTPTGLKAALHAGLRTLALTTTHSMGPLAAAERVIENLQHIDWPTLQNWYND